MFDMTVEAKVRSVCPVVMTDTNDQIRRVTNLHLQVEFDDNVAAGLGDVGRDSLKHLRSGAQKSAILPLDNTRCRVEFEGFCIDRAAGVRASASRPTKEGASPTVRLVVSFATKHSELCWLVDHLEETLKVKLSKAQTELPLAVVK